MGNKLPQNSEETNSAFLVIIINKKIHNTKHNNNAPNKEKKNANITKSKSTREQS
jgi:hypothetical protein